MYDVHLIRVLLKDNQKKKLLPPLQAMGGYFNKTLLLYDSASSLLRCHLLRILSVSSTGPLHKPRNSEEYKAFSLVSLLLNNSKLIWIAGGFSCTAKIWTLKMFQERQGLLQYHKEEH